MDIAITNYPVIIAFWLMFSRWLAILFQLPVLDNASIPVIVKVLSALLISYTFFPFVEKGLVREVITVGVDNFWALTIFHTLVGLFIGLLVKGIMSIFTGAGMVMTQQMGFSSLSYFDPTYQAKMGPFEKLIQWTILLMILSSGALIPMFRGVLDSFHSVTLLHLGKFSQIHIFYQDFFVGAFKAAFLLATPILFTNLLLNMVMGIVARTVPQMNVLMVSFVVNIGIGLIVFVSVSEEFFSVAFDMYINKLGEWFQFLI